MRIIRSHEFTEGRWRNGMGVSWDIASYPVAADDFGWRLAIARIDGDVPFSHYPNVDRVFTLIEGQGLDLEFEGRNTLAVDRLFVPHFYSCDVPTFCRLRSGPCRALNLFMKRGLAGRCGYSLQQCGDHASGAHPAVRASRCKRSQWRSAGAGRCRDHRRCGAVSQSRRVAQCGAAFSGMIGGRHVSR
jgi:hypothetical protein